MKMFDHPYSPMAGRILVAICVVFLGSSVIGQEVPTDKPVGEPEKRLFTGRVVFLEDALAERGIRTYSETGTTPRASTRSIATNPSSVI